MLGLHPIHSNLDRRFVLVEPATKIYGSDSGRCGSTRLTMMGYSNHRAYLVASDAVGKDPGADKLDPHNAIVLHI